VGMCRGNHGPVSPPCDADALKDPSQYSGVNCVKELYTMSPLLRVPLVAS